MSPIKRKWFEKLAEDDDDFRKLYLKPPKKRQNKAPGQPKRAWSAFLYFIGEHRGMIKDKNPKWRVAEISKELGRMWEACTERDKYEKLSSLDRKRYEQVMLSIYFQMISI